MINLFYGHLKNATISEGDVSFKAQYPVGNINYLSKKLYSYAYDTDEETATASDKVEKALLKIDFGSVQGGIVSCALDLRDFYVSFVSDGGDLDDFYIRLYGSSDDSTYTLVDTLYTTAIDDPSFIDTLSDIYTATFSAQTYRYWKVVVMVDYSAGTEGDNITWVINGLVDNLYIGAYLNLPCPELQPEEWENGVNLSTSYAGYRNATKNQEQRTIYTNVFQNLTPTHKANAKTFNNIAGEGALPVYYQDTEDEIDMFARITNRITVDEQTSDAFKLTQIAEEEL